MDNTILTSIPVKVGKYGKCQSCIRANLDGRSQYVKIMYIESDNTVIAELRCSHCNHCQENPLVSEMAHMYTAYINVEKSNNQLLADINGRQLTINNLNNMCIVYKQHIDKVTYDYTKLLEAYNAGKQINTDIITKNTELEENYKKAQKGINEMKEELVTLQTSSLHVIERLKSEHNEEITHLNTEARKFSNETNNRLESQISELEQANGGLKSQISELEQANGGLKSQISELEHTNKSFKTQISELEHANEGLKSTNEGLKTQILALTNKVNELNPKTKSLEQSNKDLKSQIIALKKKKMVQTYEDELKEELKETINKHKKITQTYEEELTSLRQKLMEMINENKKLKLIHKQRCFEIIKTHESVCKAHCERIQNEADSKYFAKELEISTKYEEMLKEYGADETYKLAIKSKYKSKLLLLTYFKEKNPDFGKIQPYIFDNIRTRDPHNILTLTSNTAAAGC